MVERPDLDEEVAEGAMVDMVAAKETIPVEWVDTVAKDMARDIFAVSPDRIGGPGTGRAGDTAGTH
jgi:hypothetical protein